MRSLVRGNEYRWLQSYRRLEFSTHNIYVGYSACQSHCNRLSTRNINLVVCENLETAASVASRPGLRKGTLFWRLGMLQNTSVLSFTRRALIRLIKHDRSCVHVLQFAHYPKFHSFGGVYIITVSMKGANKRLNTSDTNRNLVCGNSGGAES